MTWKEDIKNWAIKNNKDAVVQENILITDGWDPKKYQPSMKNALFDYLDKWHQLHIKNMPTPATSRRKNPSVVRQIKKFTQLPNGWGIWTYGKKSNFKTIASDGTRYLEFGELTVTDAMNIHQDLVADIGTINDTGL